MLQTCAWITSRHIDTLHSVMSFRTNESHPAFVEPFASLPYDAVVYLAKIAKPGKRAFFTCWQAGSQAVSVM
ncbi:hypothetical protein WM40_20815 [Robbsia andropogonis]|uniref:Uncharacterized protein n=1 Tax=Robbsia andropogonis TaxID=28092 RepID=A0A0F5JVF0_9BURK|nr:hypothetical protein WM40_20815 [Robbsia andropogonis]